MLMDFRLKHLIKKNSKNIRGSNSSVYPFYASRGLHWLSILCLMCFMDSLGWRIVKLIDQNVSIDTLILLIFHSGSLSLLNIEYEL